MKEEIRLVRAQGLDVVDEGTVVCLRVPEAAVFPFSIRCDDVVLPPRARMKRRRSVPPVR